VKKGTILDFMSRIMQRFSQARYDFG